MSRIALDARMTRQMSVGMKTYARELVARLPVVAPEFSYVTFDRGANFGFDEQFLLPLSISRARPSLTHYLSLYMPFFAPSPFVVTIHDLIHLRFPDMHKRRVAPYYSTVVRAACSRAARVITDDERTIEDLQRFLHVDPRKVRVIALGVEECFLQPVLPLDAPRPYVLNVGNHREHKDLATLLDAWSSLPERVELDLYFTGPNDFGGELERRSTPHRQARSLGDVDNQTLARLYAGAFALVHPALLEGFGLPMLEAMAVGCPVLACTDAVPSVLRPDTLTFAPRDHDTLRGLLLELLADAGLRRGLAERGRARARVLTWDRCARTTADLYAEVLTNHR
ncbi:MAG: glycosyltransferase family 4 protein [Vulcanimicrobiaceae bacterium]